MSNKTKDWHQIKAEYDLQEQEEAKKDLNTHLEEQELNENEEDTKQSIDEKSLDYPSHRDLIEKINVLEQKLYEQEDLVKRAKAETENIRDRSRREVNNAHRYGKESLIHELLPVLDSLEQGLKLGNDGAQNPTLTNVYEGLQLTTNLLKNVLEKFNVTEIFPEGEQFNPAEHEAMAVQATAEVQPNTILTVFQKGYKLYDRIIRPARVVVAKEKT